jgi:DNA repair protein RecO (recombination protein O)
MSTRVEHQPSYILHTRPYRDTSLLVDVLTQDHGKLCIVAKGVRGGRKAANQQRYLLQAFRPVLLSWQGKSSLKTLVDIEGAQDSLPPSLQGKKLYSAMYVNELLAYLLPQDDPTDTIFPYYQHVLSQLSHPDTSLEPCLRHFEYHLLDELGYGINFSEDADTGDSVQVDQVYFFVQNHGFVLADRHPDIRASSFSGQVLSQIAASNFDTQETRQAAKQLSRMALQPHLRGRELKSRELFSIRS